MFADILHVCERPSVVTWCSVHATDTEWGSLGNAFGAKLAGRRLLANIPAWGLWMNKAKNTVLKAVSADPSTLMLGWAPESFPIEHDEEWPVGSLRLGFASSVRTRSADSVLMGKGPQRTHRGLISLRHYAAGMPSGALRIWWPRLGHNSVE